MPSELAIRFPEGIEIFRVPRAGARAHLAALLAMRRGIDPAAVCLSYGENGKPELPGGPEFSIAHAGTETFLALGGDRPLGLDVERIVDIPEVDAIVEMLFRRRDRQLICGLRGDERLRMFYRTWVRLEAAVKARGGALGEPVSTRGLNFSTFEIAGGIVGAVAVERGPKVLRIPAKVPGRSRHSPYAVLSIPGKYFGEPQMQSRG